MSGGVARKLAATVDEHQRRGEGEGEISGRGGVNKNKSRYYESYKKSKKTLHCKKGKKKTPKVKQSKEGQIQNAKEKNLNLEKSMVVRFGVGAKVCGKGKTDAAPQKPSKGKGPCKQGFGGAPNGARKHVSNT